jgi:uncharacterized LabA/DUF88 family protein
MSDSASTDARPKNRMLLLIDGAYFHKGQQTFDMDLDIESLLKFVQRLSGSTIEHAYYYDSAPEETPLHRALRRMQIRVESRSLKTLAVRCPNGRCAYSRQPIERTVQAGVDVAIATKILTMACENEYDTLVLVAGDGDFADAVQYVKERCRKRIFVCGFSGTISNRLAPFAERGGVIALDRFLEPEETTTSNIRNIEK